MGLRWGHYMLSSILLRFSSNGFIEAILLDALQSTPDTKWLNSLLSCEHRKQRRTKSSTGTPIRTHASREMPKHISTQNFERRRGQICWVQAHSRKRSKQNSIWRRE